MTYNFKTGVILLGSRKSEKCGAIATVVKRNTHAKLHSNREFCICLLNEDQKACHEGYVTMQRHWKVGAVREEVEERFRELSSIAMVAHRDIERHLWLAEHRPDLALLAPAPSRVKMALVEKMSRKKKDVDGRTANRNPTCSSRNINNLVRSSGRECDDLRFSSKSVLIELPSLCKIPIQSCVVYVT